MVQKKFFRKRKKFILTLILFWTIFSKRFDLSYNSNQIINNQEKIERVIYQIRVGTASVDFQLERFPKLISESKKLSPQEKDEVNQIISKLIQRGNFSDVEIDQVLECQNVLVARGEMGGRIFFRHQNDIYQILAISGSGNETTVLNFLKAFNN